MVLEWEVSLDDWGGPECTPRGPLKREAAGDLVVGGNTASGAGCDAGEGGRECSSGGWKRPGNRSPRSVHRRLTPRTPGSSQ